MAYGLGHGHNLWKNPAGAAAPPAPENFVRFLTADSDRLLGGNDNLSYTGSAFTFMWRGRINSLTSTATFLAFFHSIATNYTGVLFGRAPATSTNMQVVLRAQDTTIIANLSLTAGLALNVPLTILMAGQSGGNIVAYRVDGADTSIMTPLAWASGNIGFNCTEDPALDLSNVSIGQTNAVLVNRSNFDLGLVAYWDSYIDITDEPTRRTFCDTDGVPVGVGSLPGSPAVAVRQPAATVMNNTEGNGFSDQPFVLTGVVTDVT